MRVEIFTNEVAGGWMPQDLETALGGSEESLVLFASQLAERGMEVAVHHTRPPGVDEDKTVEYYGVRYLGRQEFQAHAGHDVLISFKDRLPWQLGAKARVPIHWSADVEAPWHAATLRNIRHFVCLTAYHRSRLPWLPEELARTIPLGVDATHLADHGARRGLSALYCSSPDRGLERLLADWLEIRRMWSPLTLRVAYGWRRFDACTKGNPAAAAFKERIERMLRQTDIQFLGELPRDAMAEEYSRNAFWLLPLEQPDAELFCLNAVKAQLRGCTPVVNRIGALQETVRWGMEYADFVAGKERPKTIFFNPDRFDWSAIVEEHWLPLFEGRGQEAAA